jgi:superfamily II DNA/RNA helicase
LNTTAPPAATTFADFGLAEPILRAVTELGYREPTPIQAQAIPLVIQGRDVMGAAQTGTGKTAGFALPILQRLMPLANTSASPARHPVRALILAPTRELADQIYANVRDYARHTGLRSAVVFGGVDIQPQIAALRQGAEVLIATPGRLLDHVSQRTVSLANAEVFVMDEADRMLDMGFLPDIQRIINLLPKARQNLMFSATFSGEIRKLAESFLRDPVSVEVARRNAAAENVEQVVYRVPDAESKRAAVTQLVRERQLAQVIVFTNTKIGAGRLARQLTRDGLNAAAIHGDKTQQERLATLEGFKKGEVAVLVATDVAARGLDIAELPAVINFDLPHSPEDYVHRIGRTGRAGASGVALSLMTANDERNLDAIRKLIKRDMPEQPLELDAALLANARADITPADRMRPQREFRAPLEMRGVRRPRPGETDREAGDERAPRAARAADDPSQVSRREARPPTRPRSALPGHSDDPFFFRPYEPASVPAGTPAESAGGSGLSQATRRRASRPVAALLGGGKKA